MTIKVRQPDAAGENESYVLGHGDLRTHDPEVRVGFNDVRAHTEAYLDEAFDDSSERLDLSGLIHYAMYSSQT